MGLGCGAPVCVAVEMYFQRWLFVTAVWVVSQCLVVHFHFRLRVLFVHFVNAMASRRVSISALLCEDDPPATSPSRPLPGPSSPRAMASLSPQYRPHSRRTPSPELPHPPSYPWPTPASASRRAYNPSQDHFPFAQPDTAASQLRSSQQPQPFHVPSVSPHPPYSQSPFPTARLSSASPASTISLTHPPSAHSPSSPLLYTQRRAPSPAGFYHSPAYANVSRYDSFQRPISPSPGHSRHVEPVASSSMHHSSLSRISTTTSSFPQTLLNPVSVSPQQSPLGGLEALVQAATVERDRLEAKASLDRRPDTTRSAVQRSPERHFHSSLEAPRMHLQAPAPRAPVTPNIISGPLLRDSYSESSLRIGVSPEAHPSKRRRQSDSNSASDRSWDSLPSWDSPSQFSGLMGPGIKPRALSSEIRTEVLPTPAMSSQVTEEAGTRGRRVSPVRDHATRTQLMVEEEKHTFQRKVPTYRDFTPATIPGEGQPILRTAEPRPSLHQDIRSNIGSHPPRQKLSYSNVILEKHSAPPSPASPPASSSTPLGPSAAPTSALQQQMLAPEEDEGPSTQTHTPPRSPSSVSVVTLLPESVEMQSADSPKETVDIASIRASASQESPVALPESSPPDNDNSPTTKHGGRVILASPSTLNALDNDPSSAGLVKSLSPPPPRPNVRTDTAQAAPDTELSPRIPDLPPHEDAPYQPPSEHEADPPPVTASPSPHPPSPAAAGSRDETSPDRPMEARMSSGSETRAAASNAELEIPVNAETSLVSSGVDEVVRSPATTPLVAESISLPMPDDLPKIDDASRSINIDDDDEASAMDSKQSQIAEQKHVDMDVDEELLSLIGDDLPSRGSHTKSKKHDFVSSEGKHSSLLKQEPALNTLSSPDPSPVVTVPAHAIKQERASVLPTDAAVGTRDSEISALKQEERPSQKKKAKNLPQPKSRVKPSGSTKTKPKIPSDGLGAAPFKSKKLSVNPTKKSAFASRSRSTSAMPPGTNSVPGSENKVPGEAEPEGDEEEVEDKLYCVCKTKYDDERVMIACDRCDEWYHTSCVHMPDLEIDLVDQFICPLCVERNPHLDLRTTWKRRCLNGLRQRDPKSPEACHKPARGAFSKYCSDECGVQFMHMRISLWVENGGNQDRLWETVKNAERREGVVASARALDERPRLTTKAEDGATLAIIPPKITKADRELVRLRARLETLVQKRETLKAEMDVVAWREKVTELAMQHADTIDQCGWDQRLCFGDEEVAEFGASVLESYEEGHSQTDVDGTQEEAEWWCVGKKKCDRHSGWQKLRMAEVEFDKEIKDQALQKLTKLEREIRKRVEDILDPQVHLGNAKMLEPSSPLSRPTANGQSKHKPNGDLRKKGKKKKE